MVSFLECCFEFKDCFAYTLLIALSILKGSLTNITVILCYVWWQ